jgi:trans-2,3-dihydro-3-hydroxyanthranilate isomerase
VTSSPRFSLLDACAGEKFAGVPLAAVEDAEALSTSRMLLIAQEFNLPLTAFLLPPRDPTNSARARIFSPQGECGFRLEALLALSALIAKSRAGDVLRRGGLTIALELGDACWRCDVIANSAGVCYSETALELKPRRADPSLPTADLAAALRLRSQEIGFDGHRPSRFEGFDALDLLPVRTREALLRAAGLSKGLAALAPAGLMLYTNDAASPKATLEAISLGASLGAEALVALTGALVEFERPGDGAHEVFIDLHAHERRARVTLRFEIFSGALERLSLGAQTAFVARGEFCR